MSEVTGKSFYIEPPEAGLPRELCNYSKELGNECEKYITIQSTKRGWKTSTCFLNSLSYA